MATTLVTGASLAGSFPMRTALLLIVAGVALGSFLVAALAPLGPRLGVPSIVAARAALGFRGGALLAVFLYLSNFAWIALNNVIAASACARIAGGPASERAWAAVLGVLATAVVALGPRAVAIANRVAVPLMAAVGVLMVVRVLQLPAASAPAAGAGALTLAAGFDVVVGYQVSWILMFADYSRYTASARASGWAVFLALALSSLWLMPVGLAAAQAAGSSDPGAMVFGLGLSASGALLITLATVTTNFVNIYLSALAWKSLLPRASEQGSVWTIGLIGAALSLFSRTWLDRYADFMLLIGGALVPVGGILLVRFFLVDRPVDVDALYARGGERDGWKAAVPGMIAWAVGTAVYFGAQRWGGTLPALGAAALTYAALARLGR